MKQMLPADTFAGRGALVTGGGTGLGKAIAVELARAGAAVAIASRSAEHRAAGVEAVTAVGGRACAVELDVREPESVAAAYDAAVAELGAPVTVLVNNAAANFPVAAADLSPNGWRAVERIVLDGTFFCSQELHSRAVAGALEASIVNIATTAAFTGGPGMAHSAAAKAGVVIADQDTRRGVGARRRARQRGRAGVVPARRPAGGDPGRARPEPRCLSPARRPRRRAARAGLGGHVARVAVRRLRHRPRARRRRRQLATPRLRDATRDPDPQPAPLPSLTATFSASITVSG